MLLVRRTYPVHLYFQSSTLKHSYWNILNQQIFLYTGSLFHDGILFFGIMQQNNRLYGINMLIIISQVEAAKQSLLLQSDLYTSREEYNSLLNRCISASITFQLSSSLVDLFPQIYSKALKLNCISINPEFPEKSVLSFRYLYYWARLSANCQDFRKSVSNITQRCKKISIFNIQI